MILTFATPTCHGITHPKIKRNITIASTASSWNDAELSLCLLLISISFYIFARRCINELDDYLLVGTCFPRTKRVSNSHSHDIRLLHSASVFAMCLCAKLAFLMSILYYFTTPILDLSCV